MDGWSSPHEESGVADRRRLSFAGSSASRSCSPTAAKCWRIRRSRCSACPQPIARVEPSAEIAEEAVDEALDCLPKPRRRDAGLVRETVRRAVRGEIEQAWGKKPQTIIHVVHVSD